MLSATDRVAAVRRGADSAEFGKSSLVARTDGYLKANVEVFTTFEVKPWNRGRGRFMTT